MKMYKNGSETVKKGKWRDEEGRRTKRSKGGGVMRKGGGLN